ncbi:transposase, partial [Thomasclavelia cocleata]|uniref:transposase n=1 Tax=Thomasclavelia cocleata TaxID=69824 RepID=UPI00258BB31B
MGRKNKYSKELKLSIVKRYLNGEGSTNSLAGEINTTNNIVSNWVKKYKVFGIRKMKRWSYTIKALEDN